MIGTIRYETSGTVRGDSEVYFVEDAIGTMVLNAPFVYSSILPPVGETSVNASVLKQVRELFCVFAILSFVNSRIFSILAEGGD